jgi:hypothetical protein
VPDLTITLPRIRFPFTKLGYKYYRSQEKECLVDNVPAIVIRHPEVIFIVSSDLLLGQIPIDIRQTIASKLAKVEKLKTDVKQFPNGLILMLEKDLVVLKEVWVEVYQIWEGVVANNEFLPSKRLELNTYRKMKDGGHILYPSVSLYLILAFLDEGYLNGRALAKTASGKIALVPLSAKKGDIITFLFDLEGNSKYFVFRLIPSLNTPEQQKERASLDAVIVRWAKREFSGMDDLVLHGELVGEYFWKHNPEDRYVRGQNLVLALH